MRDEGSGAGRFRRGLWEFGRAGWGSEGEFRVLFTRGFRRGLRYRRRRRGVECRMSNREGRMEGILQIGHLVIE